MYLLLFIQPGRDLALEVSPYYPIPDSHIIYILK